MRRYVLALLVLSLAQVGCAVGVGGEPDRADFGALHRIADDRDGRMYGVWESRGYGWLFEIDEDGLTQYQQAGGTCFATPAGVGKLSTTLSLDYAYYRRSDSRDVAILQLLPDDTEVWVERRPTLPEHCQRDPDDDYAAVFEYFSNVMAEHYAFFALRGIDWQARVDAARGQIASVRDDRQLFALLAGMIDGFSDSHTKLLAEIDGERLRQQDGLGPTLSRIRAQDAETPWLIGLFGGLRQDILDPGSQHTANDRILWGMIDGRIGYIQVLQMGGFSGLPIEDPGFRQAEFRVFDDVMDAALTEMRQADFVIVDLSNNRGGFDAIARRLVARFAGQPVVAYRTFVPGADVPVRPRFAEPMDRPRYTGPVLLLTSDVTVSGGELATLGFRALPNVTHMGGVTRGSFSTVLAKPLPNGWVVELSNEVISAADGTVYEERGIPPAVTFDVFPEQAPVDGYFEALRAAIRAMEARRGRD